MRTKILYLTTLLSISYTVNAQVGIGTKHPNPSAALAVMDSNKGILIPQVALTSILDNRTITNGNVESLLIYNTTANDELSPGYYYWHKERWERLLTDIDVARYAVEGRPGEQGPPGIPGTPGAPGQNVEMVINGDGIWVFDRQTQQWNNIQGSNGVDGQSAYQLWAARPENTGKSETDFLASLRGPQGLQGATGRDGADGINGKSAYEIWVEKTENTGKSEADFLSELIGSQGEKGDKGDTGADGKSAYDLWEALPENTGKTPADFLASSKGEKGDKGDKGADGATGADGKSALELWTEKPENAGKTETDFLAALKGTDGTNGQSAYELWTEIPENAGKSEAEFLTALKGPQGEKGDTGFSTYELWKTLTGNEDKTVDDFINEQKADPRITKLIDNQNNTFTYYNETEVDNTGAPIAGTGVTIPTRTGYSLTNFIENPASSIRTPADFSYNQVTSGGSTNEKTIETLTFDVFEDLNKPKMLSYSYISYDYLSLNGTDNPNKNAELYHHIKIYINNIEVFYTVFYPKYPANMSSHIRRAYTKQIDLTNVPLTPTNNKLRLVYRIVNANNSVTNNTGTTTGTFPTGNAIITSVRCTDSSLALYEK